MISVRCGSILPSRAAISSRPPEGSAPMLLPASMSARSRAISFSMATHSKPAATWTKSPMSAICSLARRSNLAACGCPTCMSSGRRNIADRGWPISSAQSTSPSRLKHYPPLRQGRNREAISGGDQVRFKFRRRRKRRHPSSPPRFFSRYAFEKVGPPSRGGRFCYSSLTFDLVRFVRERIDFASSRRSTEARGGRVGRRGFGLSAARRINAISRARASARLRS